MPGKKSILSADRWSGKGWLFMLCFLLVVEVFVYLQTHKNKHFGYEYVSLNADQTKAFCDFVNIYPDTRQASSLLPVSACPADSSKTRDTGTLEDCSTIKMRNRRAEQIKTFLQVNLTGDVMEKPFLKGQTPDSTILDHQLADIDPTLRELNARDVTNFVTGYKFKVDSYFWLTGNSMYWEAIFWSLFGVFTSLIYYVSLANQLLLKNKVDDDIGPFDTSEISAQVAKMFYAPAVTVVVVLGYSLVAVQKGVGVDIGMGHGLIVFAFIAGFYSGRLMKMLDKIKTTIFPDSSDGTNTAEDAKAANSGGNGDGSGSAGSGDIKVALDLADSMKNDPNAAAIAKAVPTDASLTLEPAAGGSGDSQELTKPADGPGGKFTGAKIAFGKYTLKAKMDFNDGKTNISLEGSQDIEVAADKRSFDVALDKTV